MSLAKTFQSERVPVRWTRHKTLRSTLICLSGTGEHTNTVTLISPDHVTRFLKAQEKEAVSMAELRTGGW